MVATGSESDLDLDPLSLEDLTTVLEATQSSRFSELTKNSEFTFQPRLSLPRVNSPNTPTTGKRQIHNDNTCTPNASPVKKRAKVVTPLTHNTLIQPLSFESEFVTSPGTGSAGAGPVWEHDLFGSSQVEGDLKTHKQVKLTSFFRKATKEEVEESNSRSFQQLREEFEKREMEHLHQVQLKKSRLRTINRENQQKCQEKKRSKKLAEGWVPGMKRVSRLKI
jgi:hypothetical protein